MSWLTVGLPAIRRLHEQLLPPFQWETLRAVHKLGSTAYGAEIRRRLCIELGKDVAIGQVFTCLATLERHGFVTSVDDSDAARAARKKRVFKLTPNGLRALERSAAAAVAFGNPRTLGEAKG